MNRDCWFFGGVDGYSKPVIICFIDGKHMLEGEATTYLIEEKGYTYEQAVKYVNNLTIGG